MRRIMTCAIVVLLASGTLFGTAKMEFSCDRTNAIYSCGEKATISVRMLGGDGDPLTAGRFTLRLDNFGGQALAFKHWDVAKDGTKASFTGTLERPGFMRLETCELYENGKRFNNQCFGVAFDPYEIKSGTPDVPDFLDFWKKAIAKFNHDVTAPIKAEKVEEDELSVLYELQIPTYGNRTLWGYLREPKDLSRGPFRAVVAVPGAGPATYGAVAAMDEIALMVNVHYYPPMKGLKKHDPKSVALMRAEEAEWAARYPMAKVDYPSIGIAAGREESFYYPVLLGINRAVDWLAARPEVDRRRFHYSSTSQGGGFGLWLCGVNTNFTKAAVFVPALTDLLGYRQDGRKAGWPRMIESQLAENRAAAEKWAPYFDGVNFARHITIPIRYEVGAADSTCPPMAGFSAYNVTPSKDKRIMMAIGQGHGVYQEMYRSVDEWMKTDK